MKSKELQQVLGKFLKSEAAGNARVQVVLPNGEYYDITGMQLLENKLIGVRETHRLAITITPENQEPRSLCLETLWGNHKALQRIKNHGAKRKRPEA
jgi:hypothetical protein